MTTPAPTTFYSRGFESDLNGWTATGPTLTRDTVRFRTGVASLKVTASGTGGAGAMGPLVQVTPSSSLTVRSYVYVEVGQNRYAVLRLYGAGGAFLREAGATYVGEAGAAGWIETAHAVDLGADVTHAQIVVEVGVAGAVLPAGAAYYVDDVTFTGVAPSTTAPPAGTATAPTTFLVEGFESTTGGWTDPAANMLLTRDTVRFRTGVASLKVTRRPGAPGGATAYSPLTAVTPSTSLTVRSYAYVEPLHTCYAEVRLYGAGDVFLRSAGALYSAARGVAGWLELTHTLDLGTDVRGARVSIEVALESGPLPEGEAFYVDDVSFTGVATTGGPAPVTATGPTILRREGGTWVRRKLLRRNVVGGWDW